LKYFVIELFGRVAAH